MDEKLERLVEEVLRGQGDTKAALSRIETRLDHLEAASGSMRRDYEDQQTRVHDFWRDKWPGVAVAMQGLQDLPAKLKHLEEQIDHLDERIDALTPLAPIVQDHGDRIKRLEDHQLTAGTGAAIAGTGAVGGTMLKWFIDQIHAWWSGGGG